MDTDKDGQEFEHADQLLHVELEYCRLGVQHSGGASHRTDSLLPPDVPVETHQFQHTMQGDIYFESKTLDESHEKMQCSDVNFKPKIGLNREFGKVLSRTFIRRNNFI